MYIQLFVYNFSYSLISCLFTIFRYLRKNPSASRSNRLNQSSELPPRPQQSSSQSGHKKRHSHRKMKMIDINDEIEKCILYGKETTLWNNMWFFFSKINYYFCFGLQLKALNSKKGKYFNTDCHDFLIKLGILNLAPNICFDFINSALLKNSK